MEKMTFGDLLIGDEFAMDLGIETGSLSHMNKPGRERYVKTSARKYEGNGQDYRVGSVKARVWLVGRSER